MRTYPAYDRRPAPRQVPPFILYLLVTIALCFMTSSYAYSIRPASAIETRVVSKNVMQKVEVPACGSMPIHNKIIEAAADDVAGKAIIPASKLQWR